MGEKITVPCLHCGEEIPFKVEPWAAPPERAYCDDACYSAHAATPTASSAPAAR